MAKAKKRGTPRKKNSKRGRASAKPARKKRSAKRALPKKAKSKVGRAGRSARKSTGRKKQPAKTAERKASRKAPRKVPREVLEVPVEAMLIDVVEEPALGLFVVTEYESVQIGTQAAPAVETEGDKATDRGSQD